jgi:ornithine carbamoyltransferase
MSDLYKKHFLKLLDFTLHSSLLCWPLPHSSKPIKKMARKYRSLPVKTSRSSSKKTRPVHVALSKLPHLTRARHVTYLGPSGSQIGHKESIKDTARVLGRMYDGIQYRGHGQEVVETLAQYAGVPVWNGLTNEFHPTQLLADLLTMQEHLPGKAFNEMTLVYAGDARNMGNSMLEAAALTGLDLRLVAPKACWPEEPGGGVQRWRRSTAGKSP